LGPNDKRWIDALYDVVLAYNICRNEVTNKTPWEVFFGTIPIQWYYTDTETPFWKISDSRRQELENSISTVKDWEERFQVLHEQRSEIQISVKQRQLNRAANLVRKAEDQVPDGKLEVGMRVKVRRDPPNRIRIGNRKKLDAPFFEDEGIITGINPNSGHRYTVSFTNGDIMHVGRRVLKVVAPPIHSEINDDTQETGSEFTSLSIII
jgi:hypothetical protein